MAKFKVRDSDPGFKKFRKQLTGGPNAVNVGIFGAEVINETDDEGNQIDLVGIASANEFGTERIPERSFLRSTIDEKKEDFRKFIGRNKAAMVINPIERKRAFIKLGLFAEKEVVKKINKGPFVPNAPATIARKGSSKPLIDTGRMRQSVTSKVVTI